MSAPRPQSAFAQAVLCILVTCCVPGLAAAQSAQAQWQSVGRVVAFGDVHGAHAELVALLRESGIVDAGDRWAAGNTHVVSLGDLIDRGADSRKVMDLLMRLQGEAQAAGGRLHVLLGNHEAMNLLGDLRYVEAGEFAAYADQESAAGRIDPKLPPGYSGHRAAFSAGGKYGRWLLAQPVAIMINDTLFMHGGPSKALQGMNLQEINLRYRTAVTEYLGLLSQLEQANLLLPGDEYDARPQLAKERLAAAAKARGSTPDPALADGVRRFDSAAGNPLLAQDGPNWYRGAALCNETSEDDVLSPLLRQFGAARLVIGHTPTRNSRAVTRFDGRVIKLDAGMNPQAYRGRAVALFIERSGLSVRYAGEPAAAQLQYEGLFVAPSQLDDASVLAALRDGEMTVTGSRGPDELDVTLSHGGRRVPAVFQFRAAGEIRKEVAAYRLDRLMELGIVPVTVERELQGRRGMLQARPRQWTSVAQALQQGPLGTGWCSAEPQLQLIRGFDALVGNNDRTTASLLLDTAEWFFYGSSYGQAFGSGRGLPARQRERPPAPGPELRRRLGLLDEKNLAAALGNLLDAGARRALLARRDALLALPRASASP